MKPKPLTYGQAAKLLKKVRELKVLAEGFGGGVSVDGRTMFMPAEYADRSRPDLVRELCSEIHRVTQCELTLTFDGLEEVGGRQVVAVLKIEGL